MGLCLHRERMASTDRNSGLPRRHVIGLSLIAAIAVVLAGIVAVQVLPPAPETAAPTPAVAQMAGATPAPVPVAPVKTPGPVTTDAATPAMGIPIPAPPHMRDPNPPRHIAGIQDRPHLEPPPPMRDPNPPHQMAGMQHGPRSTPLRAENEGPDAARWQPDGGPGQNHHLRPPV